MKSTLFLASMRWPGYSTPICVGTNPRELATVAVKILQAIHGNGAVLRPGAMCSVPIARDDIRIEELPFIL